MAWTSPKTATTGSALTAADFNTYVRDNLLETGPNVATTNGRLIIATGANAIAERGISVGTVSTGQSTASTSYTDLATVGPSVTLTTGNRAVIFINCRIVVDAGRTGFCSVAVSGATTIAATDDTAISHNLVVPAIGFRFGGVFAHNTLTPGSNTFTLQYRTSATSAFFGNRTIIVWAF